MESYEGGVEAIVLPVIAAYLFCKELLPSITYLGIGGVGVLFAKGCDDGVALLTRARTQAGEENRNRDTPLRRLASSI